MRMATGDGGHAVLDCAFDRVVSDLFRQYPVEEGKPFFGEFGHVHWRRPEFDPTVVKPLYIAKEPLVSGLDLVEVVTVYDKQPISDLQVPFKRDPSRFLQPVSFVVIPM